MWVSHYCDVVGNGMDYISSVLLPQMPRATPCSRSLRICISIECYFNLFTQTIEILNDIIDTSLEIFLMKIFTDISSRALVIFSR